MKGRGLTVSKIEEPDCFFGREDGELANFFVCIPFEVFDVSGDDLTRSSTHGAGIAVRFPRLVRLRSDKSPKQATTVKEVEEMYKSQGGTIR